MKASNLIRSSIERFYTEISDEERFKKGLGPLELERNKDLIQRYLKNSKSVILDIGGGTGIYSEWLANLGHYVHLIDPVPKHVIKARKRCAKSRFKFECHLGESQDLPFADNFADLVILHGPLYHLQSKRERTKAIKEAKRVCKVRGTVVGFGINYASYTLASLMNGIIHQPEIFEMCRKHLVSGIHNPPVSKFQQFLPEAYFHKPSELINEFEELDLREIELLAVEGLIWLDQNYYETREDSFKKKTMMNLLRLTENDRSLISISPHMMIAGKKR